ncbi:MAG: sugar nucleotide-binding protein [Alphaproteobacteria bacterium]|nr:sugar nucleotide-binding protein [Alphaproteobacteria bacterium]
MFIIIGGDSTIGEATARYLRERAHTVVATTRRQDRVGPMRPFLDLSSPLNAWTPPQGAGACVCAAVARIAACETDPAGSAFVNVDQTLVAIDRLLESGASVVFLSSDKVFDGSRAVVPPDAPVCPATAYGRQKARVEAALRERMAAGLPAAILRLAKVIAPDTALLQDWVVALRNRKPVRAFHDMVAAPVPVALVARAVAALLDDRAHGIFQLSGPRDVPYSALALELARRLGAQESLVCPESVSALGLPTGATSKHTTLDSSLLADRYGLHVPDAFDVLADAITTRFI